MAASLLVWGVSLGAGQAFAQNQTPSEAQVTTVLRFTKPANMIPAMAAPANPGDASQSQLDAAPRQATFGPASEGVVYFEAAPLTPAPELRPSLGSSQPALGNTAADSSNWSRPVPDRDSERRPAMAPPTESYTTSSPASTLSTDRQESIGSKSQDYFQIARVAYQATTQGPRTPAAEVEPLEYHLQLEPPGRVRVFRLDSELQLNERMRQEARERPIPERIQFPDEPVISRERYAGRKFPAKNLQVEPNYVCHGRLYFEEKNSERFGWDLGIVQPFVSAGTFFFDVASLPYHLATDPCRYYDSNAGLCLPGDPVPYLLYPPELSTGGAVAEIGTAFLLLTIFP